MTKICIKCGRTRPVSEFRLDGNIRADGHRYRRTTCVKCDVEGRQPQQWLQKAADTIRHHAKRFITQGWIADVSEMEAKLNWRVRSIAAQLEHAFQGVCPGCDEPFATMAAGRAALTVDVCDPTRPPVWSINTRFACSTCNKEKHAAGPLAAARLELAKCVPAAADGERLSQLSLFTAEGTA